MGNELSQEEENELLEEAYSMSLDNPEVDKKVNVGTTAPNCQPKHTREELKKVEEEKALKEAKDQESEDGGLEVVMSGEGEDPEFHLPDDGSSRPLSGSEAGRRPGEAGRRPPSRRSSAEENEQKKLSYFQMARIGYQELVNAIIRPPRADYKEEALGPPAFTFCGRRFTRTDFALRTKRGQSLQCSHWEPVERTSDRIPVVIYMHGNSSARVEVIPQLSYLLSLGLAVFSFDFTGSGKSDGEYVSLGYYEREDLMCVIAHLRATNVVSTIALWGRSMGAATALMHGDRDPSIACMILDSPFADLTQLAEEMVEKGRDQGINVPNFVVAVALRLIRASVRKQANFDIRQISPIAHADKCFIPALFVAGEHDDFINKRHSEAIHARYAGDKNLIVVEGDHNSPRPKFMFDSVSIFLQTCLQIPSAWALRVHPGMNLMAPPWFFPGNGESRTVFSPQRSASARSNGTQARPKNSASAPARRSTRKSDSYPSEGSGGVAMGGGGDGSEEIGMTAERQREIQASLFKMLGQSDDTASAVGASAPSKSSAPSRAPNGEAVRQPGKTPPSISHSLSSASVPKQSDTAENRVADSTEATGASKREDVESVSASMKAVQVGDNGVAKATAQAVNGSSGLVGTDQSG